MARLAVPRADLVRPGDGRVLRVRVLLALLRYGAGEVLHRRRELLHRLLLRVVLRRRLLRDRLLRRALVLDRRPRLLVLDRRDLRLDRLLRGLVLVRRGLLALLLRGLARVGARRVGHDLRFVRVRLLGDRGRLLDRDPGGHRLGTGGRRVRAAGGRQVQRGRVDGLLERRRLLRSGEVRLRELGIRTEVGRAGTGFPGHHRRPPGHLGLVMASSHP
ncbi:hypothetical protein Aglo03_64840 [Actinokineospora globicatena]|uniref:Uncharacterized protein n=1 Tax=Actinokineospora globicatena TaxID=103729 RepID=A0A9W6QV54_9PSEU|nr:hypothetical protein Aglo03_64840 [Actinokineospora globicatena]